MPDNYVAWHCGGTTNYKHVYCRNMNSIGIELCDDVKDGKVYPSELTIKNAIELTKHLMKKYNIPAANVIRHYDVTGKLCPAYWCGTSAKDALWKTAFWNKLGTTSTNNTVAATFKPYTVKINTAVLNVRKGPGTNYAVAMTVTKNYVYTIVEEKNGWGKLKSGAGWIKLSYTIKQ